MKQNRHAFNGGIIGEELWSRNDLQRYQSSCKHLDNMVVTAQGGVKRRDPIQLLSKIELDTQVGDKELHKRYRIIPFIFSATETFQIILTNSKVFVYKDVPDIDIGSTGSLIATINTPYLANIDLSELNFQQSNDVIYLVHNDLKPKRIERRSDTDWRVVDVTFTGGPYLPLNQHDNNIMTFNLPAYNATTSYNEGSQVVTANLGRPINGSSVVTYWKTSVNGRYQYFLDRIPINSSGLQVGDSLTVSNAGRLTGTWDIQRLGTGYIEVNTGVYKKYERPPAQDDEEWRWYYGNVSELNSFGSSNTPPATVITNGYGVIYTDDKLSFYESRTSGNVGHPVTDTNHWIKRAAFTAQLNLQSNFPVFSADDVGTTIGIEQSRKTVFKHGSFNAAGAVSDPFPAYGSVTLTSGGIWGGSLHLEESQDNGETWNLLGSISTASKYNSTITREIEQTGTVIRTRMDQWIAIADANSCSWKVEIGNTGNESTLRVDQFINEKHVIVKPLDYIISNKPTSNWKMGAFSKDNGYPSSICIHEERLFFAGTKAKPSTLYGSKVNDWQDFRVSDYETSPLTFTLASDNVNKIRWMVSKKQLLIGTDTSEWVVSNGDQNKVLSGVNLPSVRKQTDKGSSHLQALSDNSQVFFIQRDSKQLQSTQFSYEADSYQTKHVSILAPEIAGAGGFVNVSVQRVPSTVIWLTKADGTLVSFTHDEENQVQGFSNHYINDSFATIIGTCVIPDTHSDVVYVLYKHNNVIYYGKMTDKVNMDHSIRVDNQPATVHRIEFTSSDQASGRELHIKLPKTFKTTHDITRAFKLTGNKWSSGLPFADNYLRNGFKIVPAATGITFQTTDSNGELFEWYKLTDLSGNGFVQTGPNQSGGEGDPLEEEGDEPDLIPFEDTSSSTNLSTSSVQIVYSNENFDISKYYSLQHGVVGGTPLYLGGLTNRTNLTPPNLQEGFPINKNFSILGDMIPFETDSMQPIPPQEIAYTLGKTLEFKRTGLTYESNRGFNQKVFEIGIPVSYLLNPTVYFADQNSPRTSVIKKLYVYLVNSIGGEVSVDGGKTWSTIKYRGTSEPSDALIPFSGVKEIVIGSGYREEMEVIVRGKSPHPIHITNMGIEFDVTN